MLFLLLVQVIANIPYGSEDPSQVLDLYESSNASSPSPVVIHVHGGNPPVGDKNTLPVNHPELLAMLLDNDIAVASINYRDALPWAYPTPVEDVALAVQFLRHHDELYALDGQRIALWGDSTGALSAGLAAYGADQADAAGGPVEQESSRVLACVLSTGITDFTLMTPSFSGQYFGYPTLADVPPTLLLQGSITWTICNVARESTPPCGSVYALSPQVPPLSSPHAFYFQKALHSALRQCETEAHAQSLQLIRQPSNDVDILEWLHQRFGMKKPVVLLKKKP